ncbi:nucleotidyltransferase [Yersinia ruckeri]|nr:nucleotidyltransferase [Yersinia ruckeri]
MNNEQTKRSSWEYFLLRAARKISLSEPQYEKINSRYDQLQSILSASDDPLLAEAHIFPQGSMRLKTTINPVPDAPADLGTIDADAIVWLPHAKGVDAGRVLGAIEKRFKEGSRVQGDIQQLRRGVRIVYADQNPGFHIDVTPARACFWNEQDNGLGMLEVPDRELGWKASSPIPYSDWLHHASSREIMLESSVALNKSFATADSATQDPLPEYGDYQKEDPLRASIKLLKRHRDEWAIRTKNEKNRPISAVITTLATHAYLDVVKQSQQRPFTPLGAIIEIVRIMPTFIRFDGHEYLVCNPQDSGENFAEKWNRPREGQSYRRAFNDWHENACQAVTLGLQNYSSTDSFALAVKESFGIGRAFVDEINSQVPASWTMPGRAAGVTRNAASMGALFGSATSSNQSQANVKPVGRLG